MPAATTRKRAAATRQRPLRRHVAVLLSGAFRTLLNCNTSVQTFIMQANPHVHFDFFAFLTVDYESDVPAAKKAARESLPCVSAVRIETAKQVTASVRKMIHAPEYGLHQGRGTATGKAVNIIKMFYGISAAQRLFAMSQKPCDDKSQPLSTLAAALRPRYDLVLRLRPDLCFCKPLDLSATFAATETLHVPWAAEGLAFDQLAVGSPAVMARYAMAFETTLRQEVELGLELYPEAVMGKHVQAIGQHPPSILEGFAASLARRGGKNSSLKYDDPYRKLKLDLAADSALRALSLPECMRVLE